MRYLVWALVGLVIVAIVVGSLVSGLVRWPSGISPTITHVSAYALLGGLMTLALILTRIRRAPLLALLLTVCIGTSVEFAQMLVPVREFHPYDLAMNCIGAGIGVVCAAVLRWVRVI